MITQQNATLEDVFAFISEKYQQFLESISYSVHMNEDEVKMFKIKELVVEMASLNQQVHTLCAEEGGAAVREFYETGNSHESETIKITIAKMIAIFLKFSYVLEMTTEKVLFSEYEESPESSLFYAWFNFERLISREVVLSQKKGYPFDYEKAKYAFLNSWSQVTFVFKKYDTEVPIDFVFEIMKM